MENILKNLKNFKYIFQMITNEIYIFEKVMYKNSIQHKKTKYFQKLKQVNIIKIFIKIIYFF